MSYGTRFIHDPLAGKSLGSTTLAKDGQSEITYHDVPETGDEAKKLFDTVRKHASMRAALEAI